MPSSSVNSIERVLDILEVFQASKRPLSLTELSAAANIPKSTCHAIVATLSSRGYMYSLTSPRALYPTKRMYEVAQEIALGDPFVESMKLVLENLRDVTEETVILGKQQGDSVVYLHVVESRHSIRYSAASGNLKPMYSSAIGKAILGTFGEKKLHEWMHGRELKQITSNTLTTSEALVQDISSSRMSGYYRTRGENVSDVWAVAAPFRLNQEVFAIAVAGPHNRIDSRIEALERHLGAACAKLSKKYGRAD